MNGGAILDRDKNYDGADASENETEEVTEVTPGTADAPDEPVSAADNAESTAIEGEDAADGNGEDISAGEPGSWIDEVIATEEIPEEDRCVKCGEKVRDRSVSEDSELCTECRAKMLHVGIKWHGVLLAILTIVVSWFAVTSFKAALPVAKATFKAGSAARESRLGDAIKLCDEAQSAAESADKSFKSVLVREWEEGSIGAKIFAPINNFCNSHTLITAGARPYAMQVKAYARAYSTLTAGTMIEDKFPEGLFRLPKYKIFALYKAHYSDSLSLSDEVYKILEDYLSSSNSDYARANFATLTDSVNALENADRSEFDKKMLTYFRFYVVNVSSDGSAEWLAKERDALDKVAEVLPEETELYRYQLALCLKNLGDTDAIVELCDKLIANNLNDTIAYFDKASALAAAGRIDETDPVLKEMDKYDPTSGLTYAAKAYVKRLSGDLKGAAEICATGIDKAEFNSDVIELYRQASMTQMAAGDYKAAYDSAYEGYYYASQSQALTEEMVYTLTLSAKLSGETGTYNDIMSTINSYNLKIPDGVQQCMDGKLTAAELFTTGRGDVR